MVTRHEVHSLTGWVLRSGCQPQVAPLAPSVHLLLECNVPEFSFLITSPCRRGHVGIAVAGAFVHIAGAGVVATVGSGLAGRSGHSHHAGETVITHRVIEPHTLIARASRLAAALGAAPASISARHDEVFR
ncbi:hypothetical protein KC19_2G166400 [Ceratodon purpureus]|uniref:Uncharacterized protein n=1 Tax=Ceratodon purpureus TaxID=3225 RepID=A0A8T0IXJ4_CERPU|nr:hypothetical protein KC19_2G166400 [Ceratodon purpureus]